MWYIADMLRLAYIWLPFEIQKYWLDIPFWQEEIQARLDQLSVIEKKRFGKKVYEDIYEVEVAYQSVQNTSWVQDNDIYTTYIQKLEWYRWKIDWPVWCIFTWESAFLKKMKETQISRDIYVQIFDLTMYMYGMKRKSEIKELSSMYDATEALYIPDSQKYDEMSMYDVLKLIKHEIETHYVVLENNKTLLGSYEIRGANNLFKEEWLAIFNEVSLFARVQEQVFEKQCGASLNLVLQHELLACQDFLDLRSYMKWWAEYDYAAMLRFKRNYSLYHPWSQHKDVSYRRWRNQVIDYIQWWWDYAALYLAKVDLEDTKMLDDSLDVDAKKNLLYPKFFADRLLLDVESIDSGETSLSRDTFESVIRHKYTYINFDALWFGAYTQEQESIYQKCLQFLVSKI